jgi:hypothetical protein
MAKAKPKAAAPKQAAPKQAPDQRDDQTELKPSDADAPGPITPEHESGSWEQTQEEQEDREDREEKR